jgi:hypothetical protein
MRNHFVESREHCLMDRIGEEGRRGKEVACLHSGMLRVSHRVAPVAGKREEVTGTSLRDAQLYLMILAR